MFDIVDLAGFALRDEDLSDRLSILDNVKVTGIKLGKRG